LAIIVKDKLAAKVEPMEKNPQQYFNNDSTMIKQTGKKPAKTCYTHIGGKLGTLLLEKFIGEGWIAKEKSGDKHFFITDKGQEEFTKLGIDLSQIKSEEL